MRNKNSKILHGWACGLSDPSFSVHVSVCLSFLHSLTSISQGFRPKPDELLEDQAMRYLCDKGDPASN